MNKISFCLSILALCSCFTSKNDPIKQRISNFFEIVYVQKKWSDEKLWGDSMYFPENVQKDQCISQYKLMFETIIAKDSCTILPNCKKEVCKYNDYPQPAELRVFEGSDKNAIYILKTENSPQLYYFLIKEQKISSFLTMTKGKKSYFVNCQ